MKALDVPSRTVVVRQELAQPPDFVAKKFSGTNNEQAIFIQRISEIKGEPVALLEAYFTLKYREALIGTDLDNQSIYGLLNNHYGLTPGHADTVISVSFADEEQSALLQVREGAPLLKLDSFTWTDRGEIFEFTSSYYRSDRFELELEQT
jgi:GntR family transcriptional regulator